MADCPHYIQENIIDSVQGRFIYKDECVKCYTNQKDDEGVTLCLRCLVGGCDEHALLHKKQTNHPIVLNFKSKLKPKESKEEERPKEITKLAIGKPGGADFSDEEWEQIVELKCLECKKTLDQSKFQGIITSVIKAESASLKSSLAAWELEIVECAHVQTLVQTDKKNLGDKGLAKCSKCDLSSNLWLCLFCGFLGCGRKYHDGTGGNNHQIDHFKETNHGVCVKLGTITPDGNASVHCYACDEEVKDSKLKEHLANFGINIARLEKTEKSIAELNLQMNLNLTLSSVIEKGRKITPLFGPGFTGMQNLGNSCYMNSVLQVLFSIDEFQKRYFEYGAKHLEECDKFTPDCFICQMSKVGVGLFTGKHSQKKKAEPVKIEGKEIKDEEPEFYQDGIRPFMFKMIVGKGHQEFSSDRQQDASEYWRHVLSFIQRSEKKSKLDDITKLFEFEKYTKLSCTECASYKLNDAKHSEIELPVPKTGKTKTEHDPVKDQDEQIPIVGFDECLKTWSAEIVQLECPKCAKTQNFMKKYYFKTWPKYLVATTNRIRYDDWVISKDISEIQFEKEVIDFSSFILPPEGSNESKIENLEEEGPKVDEGALNQLLAMGFGENRCKRALLANNNNPDAAMNWLLERIDDASLDDPIKKSNSQGGGVIVNPELIGMLTAMGFTDKQAEFALKQCNNDAERAADYLFNHPDIDTLIKEEEGLKAEESSSSKNPFEKAVEKIDQPDYALKGVIVHLGRNYQSGHYVCYVKKDGKWIYYNDAKVAESSEPAIGKGTIFLFERSN